MFNLAMDVTISGGTIVTVGHGTHGIDSVRERLSFHSNPDKGEFWGRNLCVRGNLACHFSDFTDQLALIRNGLPIGDLITARYPIEQYEEAYKRFMGGLEGKVIFTH